MNETRDDGRFSELPLMGKGTGNDVAKGLDPKDPEFAKKLAERAGFKYTEVQGS